MICHLAFCDVGTNSTNNFQKYPRLKQIQRKTLSNGSCYDLKDAIDRKQRIFDIFVKAHKIKLFTKNYRYWQKVLVTIFITKIYLIELKYYQ